ncbi:hypothetical protein CKA32_007161 [Geitlerinema sp. FC II]|nr:hypothetical protein CKA32_007161 [Geitlerinema sp. FC II]
MVFDKTTLTALAEQSIDIVSEPVNRRDIYDPEVVVHLLSLIHI